MRGKTFYHRKVATWKYLTGFPSDSFALPRLYILNFAIVVLLTNAHFILLFHPQPPIFFALLFNESPFCFSCLSSMCPCWLCPPCLPGSCHHLPGTPRELPPYTWLLANASICTLLNSLWFSLSETPFLTFSSILIFYLLAISLLICSSFLLINPFIHDYLPVINNSVFFKARF